MKSARVGKGALGLVLAAAMLLFAIPGGAFADTSPSISWGKPVVSTETSTAHSYQFPNATVAPVRDEDDDIEYQLITVSITGGGTMEKTPWALLKNSSGTLAVFNVNPLMDVDDIEDMLRTIVFAGCTSTTKITATIDANDASWSSDKAKSISQYGDHYYMFVEGSYSWTMAYNTAKTYKYNGMQGYLATITSSEEYDALRVASTSAGWIGGTLMVYNDGSDTKVNDAENLPRTEGSFAYRSTSHYNNSKAAAVPDYYWACGPEAGEPFDGALSNSDSEPNAFQHIDHDQPWNTEHNQLGMIAYESCLAANNENRKMINDITEAGFTASGYADGFFVEFGGYETDPGNPDASLTASDTVSLSTWHTHDLRYAANGNVLTVTCAAAGDGLCSLPEDGLTLTLANDSKTYDGKAVEMVGDGDERADWAEAGIELPAATFTRSDTETGEYAAVDEVKRAGYYKAELSVGGATATSTYRVDKAQVKAYLDETNPIVTGKTYDGTTSLSIGSSENWYLSGKVDGDELSITASGTFEDANVGQHKRLTVSDPRLGGKDAGNYTCVLHSTFAVAPITPREATLAWSGIELTYNGAAQVPACTVTNALGDDKVRVTVSGAQTNAGLGYTATATALDNSNYKLPDAGTTVEFSIAKASIAPTVSIDDWAYGDEASVPSVTGNPGGGEVNYEYAARTDGDAQSEDGWSTEAPTAAGEYTVRAAVAATGNYEGAVATADFIIARREVALEWGEAAFTYNGSEQAPSCTAGNLVEGDAVDVAVTGAKADAGEGYTATAVSLSNDNYRLPAATTKTFSIAPKPIEGAKVVLGPGLTENGHEQEQAVASVTLSDGTVLAATDYELSGNKATKAGAYKLTVTGTGNYTGTVEVEFTVAARPDVKPDDEDDSGKGDSDKKDDSGSKDADNKGSKKTIPATGDDSAATAALVAASGVSLAAFGAATRRRKTV